MTLKQLLQEISTYASPSIISGTADDERISTSQANVASILDVKTILLKRAYRAYVNRKYRYLDRGQRIHVPDCVMKGIFRKKRSP